MEGIHLISSLGAGASHEFRPCLNVRAKTLFLGHFVENHGEHYIALTGLAQEENIGR